MRILLVEDDRMIAEGVRKALRRYPDMHRTIAAASASNAASVQVNDARAVAVPACYERR